AGEDRDVGRGLRRWQGGRRTRRGRRRPRGRRAQRGLGRGRGPARRRLRVPEREVPPPRARRCRPGDRRVRGPGHHGRSGEVRTHRDGGSRLPQLPRPHRIRVGAPAVATSLPTPIEFRLPEDWRPVPPDEVDATDTAFVALLPDPDRGFTANVTIDGSHRPDTMSLTAMADRSVQTLRDALAGPDAVAVLNREEVGSAD